MDDVWSALVQYKQLEDQVNSLRSLSLTESTPHKDLTERLSVAEAELAQLKLWIHTNFVTKRVD